jgi:hypothetical protein
MRRHLTILIAIAAAACNPNDALKPPDPGAVTKITAAALPGLQAGAVSEFQVAFSGTGDDGNGGREGHVNLTAIFTDELTAHNLDIFTFRNDLDARKATPQNTQLAGIYSDLSAARHAAEFAATEFAALDPKNIARAQMLNFAGYTYTMFAEDWCTGIPFSNLNADGTITHGVPQTTAQVYATALAKFDSATALASASQDPDAPNELQLALMGRARALLDQDKFDAAGAAADSLLTANNAFTLPIENSANTPRQYNGVWYWSTQNAAFGVVDRKDGNGLNFISSQDPRALWVDSHNLGAVGIDTIIYEQKYTDKASSIELAGATEATLISAERDLVDGQVASWAAKLNALRARSGLQQIFYDTVATTPTVVVDTIKRQLPPLTADSTTLASDSVRVEVHFRERALWLWLTGHRLPDLRRLLRHYHHNDFTNALNNDIRFAIPVFEQNNPNFKQCADVGSEQP